MSMWSSVEVKAGPTAYALTAADMRLRLRVDDPAEDPFLEDLIAAAAAMIDGPDALGIAMTEQTWTLHIQGYPAMKTPLPGWPVMSISEIRMVDEASVSSILDPSEYSLRGGANCHVRFAPSFGAAVGHDTEWEIDYVVGHSDLTKIDKSLILAQALIVGHFFEHREAVIDGMSVQQLPMGAPDILERFRRNRVAG